MKVRSTSQFDSAYAKAPQQIRKAFDKQLQFLTVNFRHPSLQSKKYNEHYSIWQARVTRGWRFYFTIVDDTYYLVDIIPHPK